MQPFIQGEPAAARARVVRNEPAQAMAHLLALVACLVASALAAPSPPYWGPAWSAPFNQTITIYTYKWVNTVGWLYDSTTTPVGSSLYSHSKGQHDEICTGVKGHETTDEPCLLLASNDTWRYVIYPDSGECCRVCSTADDCGIVLPGWLQHNASYEGAETIAGLDCEGWMKQGGEQNYYYAEKTTQQPCLYYEGGRGLPPSAVAVRCGARIRGATCAHHALLSPAPVSPSRLPHTPAHVQLLALRAVAVLSRAHPCDCVCRARGLHVHVSDERNVFPRAPRRARGFGRRREPRARVAPLPVVPATRSASPCCASNA